MPSRIRSRCLVGLVALIALLATAASASAASAPFRLSTDGKPLVLTVVGHDEWNGQPLSVACVDSTPVVTIAVRPNASTETTLSGQLQATWLPSSTLQLPGFAGAPFWVPQNGSTTVDPSTVFDWESGGGGLMQSVPVGHQPGTGTLWLSAYRYQRAGGFQVQQFSNSIAVRTKLRKGATTTCVGRQILLPAV